MEVTLLKNVAGRYDGKKGDVITIKKEDYERLLKRQIIKPVKRETSKKGKE